MVLLGVTLLLVDGVALLLADRDGLIDTVGETLPLLLALMLALALLVVEGV